MHDSKLDTSASSFFEIMSKVLAPRWKLLVFIWMICLIIWVVVAFVSPKYYTSQATFQVSVENSTGLAIPEGLKMLTPGFKSAGGAGVQLAILDSRELAMSMIQMFNLKLKYKTKWDHLAIKRFRKDFEFESLDEGIEQVSFTYPSQDSVKIILDSILGFLNAKSIKYATSKARLEFEFNRNLVDSVFQHMDSISLEWVMFMEKNKMVNIKENVSLSLKAYGTIEQSLMELETQYVRARADNEFSPQERENLKAQIALLRNKKSSLLRGSTKADGLNEDLLSINYDSIPKLTSFEERLGLLLERDKTVLKALIPKLEESRIRTIETTPILNIIDPTFVPPYKSGPKRVLIILIGTVLTGGILSTGFILLVLFRDSSLGLRTRGSSKTSRDA